MINNQAVFLLTKSTNFIIGPISDILAYIMNVIFNIVYSISEVGSLGISIILFTVIIKLLMVPLMLKQQKSMKRMQEVQPQIEKIKRKYENKKDPESQQKLQKEIGEFYRENKVNPVGGCLPMLIQLPILFALFNVLRNLPAYIVKVGDVFQNIAEPIMATDGYEEVLSQLSEGKQISDFVADNINKVIELLSKFGQADWTNLVDTIPQISEKIGEYTLSLNNMNSFLGINLAESPGLNFPGILFPILGGLTTYISSKMMTTKNNNTNDQAAQTQKTMTMIFPFMTAFFTYSMPSGLGLYWITSNLFQIGQQYVMNNFLDEENKEAKK